MFENLSNRLQEAFARLRGKGRLREADIDAALKEVRMALLEADVNFKVAKSFVASVRERALGQEVLKSLTPAQQVIKIVNEELTRLMGEEAVGISFSPSPPTVILLVGLQGSGKTTTAGKLAKLLREEGRSPVLVAADVYRPAAVDQLRRVGDLAGVPVLTAAELGVKADPVRIARAGIEAAKRSGRDLVIIDSAGRLHIDDSMMDELRRMKAETSPHEVLLVVDAMTGQEAVNIAKTFDQRLGVSGVILTKLDGDARGGAALSVRAVTEKPIKFVGVGEKLGDLQPFHPSRMSSRILGMGDVLTLIERAERSIDQKKAQELRERLRSDQFTLEDFVDQLRQIRKMGPLEELLSMIPGTAKLKKVGALQVDERELVKIEAIINSMTREERVNPAIIDGSRRKRIARGSGTRVQDVNRVLKQFQQTRKLMKQLSGVERQLTKGNLRFPFLQ